MAVAYRSHATNTVSVGSSALNIPTAPAGVVDGDFLVAFVATNTVHAVGTVPSGWTQIGVTQDHGTDTSMSCIYKIASSEPASYTFSGFFAATEIYSVVMAAYSGVDAATPLDGVTPVQETSGTTATAPSITITPTTADAMILFMLGCDPGVDPLVFTANTPSGSVARASAQEALNSWVGLVEYVQPTPGATTITASTSGDAYCETAICLRPAAVGLVFSKAVEVTFV